MVNLTPVNRQIVLVESKGFKEGLKDKKIKAQQSNCITSDTTIGTYDPTKGNLKSLHDKYRNIPAIKYEIFLSATLQ